MDASNPDRENQLATVNDTLKMLDIDSSKTIIQVYNKLDKLSPEQVFNTSDTCISAKNGSGNSFHIFQMKLNNSGFSLRFG